MMGNWTMGSMWIWPVIVVAGLLLLGYAALRLLQQPPTGPGPDAGSSARRILDERYARGQVDDEEYRQRRGMLP
jgi:putative membrane protein